MDQNFSKFKDIEKYIVPCVKHSVIRRCGDSGEIVQCFLQSQDAALNKKKAYHGALSMVDKKWIIL